jgi:hypothetical protein
MHLNIDAEIGGKDMTYSEEATPFSVIAKDERVFPAKRGTNHLSFWA